MAKVAFEDLSGTSTPVTSNPYDGILQACNNDPQLIQIRYHTHRTSRNQQQRDKILSPDFSGWILDPVLTKLTGPQADPSFTDPRNCLVFWARPTHPIKTLIATLQQKLQAVAPGLWLMPQPNLHMTAMEITHSLTAPEIDHLVSQLLPSCKTIADLPSSPSHVARLVKPMLSFDAAAFALSFLPGAADAYTYHHLRRDLYSHITAVLPVASRYVVPSAHLTIARFNTPNPFVPADGDRGNPLDPVAGIDRSKRAALMREVDSLNAWLRDTFWSRDDHVGVDGSGGGGSGNGGEGGAGWVREGGEWIVGQEKGLDFRKGVLWYGGGETVCLGKGIGAE